MSDGELKVVFKCPWWSVVETHYTGGDGEPHVWYSANRQDPQTVHILGITDEGMVPLIRQWRAPVGEKVWELPAGILDVEGEPLEDAAHRELTEETGYTAGRMLHLFTGTVSPGITNELFNAFLALDLTLTGEGGGVDSEEIEVELIPFPRLLRFVLDRQSEGELVDAKIITHITLALGKLADMEGG